MHIMAKRGNHHLVAQSLSKAFETYGGSVKMRPRLLEIVKPLA